MTALTSAEREPRGDPARPTQFGDATASEGPSNPVVPGGARTVVLCSVRHYLPGYRSGGPVRSLSRLVEELGDTFDIRIVCLDRDTASDEPYALVTPGRWVSVGRARVLYLRPGGATLAAWRMILDDVRPDLLYVNSLFDATYSIRPVWLAAARALPTIVAPRGELSPGALGLKRLKKWTALAVLTRLPHYSKVWWHACSDGEAADIADHFDGSADRTVVIPNLPTVTPVGNEPWKEKTPGTLRVMFLGRIVPKKNLLGAIEGVARAGDGVLLDIWGPVEDEQYARQCEALVEALGVADRVSWCGPIAHDDVYVRMLAYDIFFLPTLGENFGHVILEALSAGLPIIISDRTPWRELGRARVGADFPPGDIGAFARELQHFRGLDHQGLLERRRLCVAFAADWCARQPGAHGYGHMWTQVSARRRVSE